MSVEELVNAIYECFDQEDCGNFNTLEALRLLKAHDSEKDAQIADLTDEVERLRKINLLIVE